MIQVSLSEEILAKCPALQIVVIDCEVRNTPSNPQLWEEIAAEEERLRQQCSLSEANKLPTIQATRQAYKACGKDPNRYRPSAESLRRRILRGLPLYRIDTLVDLINLVSFVSGYSIGGFDADRIDGPLVLGIGREGEPYVGIGRGELNIAGLPVYRDRQGGIGTPTSDEERTKIGPDTCHLRMIINGYSGLPGLEEAARYAIQLLKKYAFAINIEAERFTSTEKSLPLSTNIK
ncbi:MAG: B3/4 domain-containing protein [Parabacteroides sp.]